MCVFRNSNFSLSDNGSNFSLYLGIVIGVSKHAANCSISIFIPPLIISSEDDTSPVVVVNCGHFNFSFNIMPLCDLTGLGVGVVSRDNTGSIII